MASIAAKTGRMPETLRKRVRQARRDQGLREGSTASERERLKALDTGCADCQTTFRLIDQATKAPGMKVEPEKIMGHEVMSLPGVVVDGQVVHPGSVSSRAA